MEMLKGEVSTPFIFLMLSGLVMIVTLITSKKARSVTETEINLSRQAEGIERFGSSLLARAIVRNSLRFNRKLTQRIPKRLSQTIENGLYRRLQIIILIPMHLHSIKSGRL
jgi:hypothetical protein